MNHEHRTWTCIVKCSFIEMFISSIKFQMTEYHTNGNKISIHPLNISLFISFELHIFYMVCLFGRKTHSSLSIPCHSIHCHFDFLLCLCAVSSFSFKWKFYFTKLNSLQCKHTWNNRDLKLWITTQTELNRYFILIIHVLVSSEINRSNMMRCQLQWNVLML